MRNSYWHTRMEKWGAWRLGVRGKQVSSLVRAMEGTPRSTCADNSPRDYSEESETNDLVCHLGHDERELAHRAYPGKFRLAQELGIDPKTLRDRLSKIHMIMGRMLDQRRRGEDIDPGARRVRPRTRVVKINNRKAAVVCE